MAKRLRHRISLAYAARVLAMIAVLLSTALAVATFALGRRNHGVRHDGIYYNRIGETGGWRLFLESHQSRLLLNVNRYDEDDVRRVPSVEWRIAGGFNSGTSGVTSPVDVYHHRGSRVNWGFHNENWGVSITHWLATSLLLAPAAVWTLLLLFRRYRRRVNAHLCPSCSYDLRATPNRCPECGHVPDTLLAPTE